MKELLTIIFLGIGAAFMLLAAIGIVRLPDLFTRMHAATKVGTMGGSGLVFAFAIHFDDLGVTTRALFVIAFLFLTAPIAAHMIGRAAYFVGVPLWERTVLDELKGRYNTDTNTLDSPPGKDAPPAGDSGREE